MSTDQPSSVDPFDLPVWLGTAEVTWSSDGDGFGRAEVHGSLEAGPGSGTETTVACDLLAVDEAYPRPVADDELRRRAHLAWRHGEVHLVDKDGRLTLAVPGTAFTAEHLIDAIGRLARAVGARPESYSVRLRLGR